MRKHGKTLLALLAVGILLPLWVAEPAPGSQASQIENAPLLPSGGLRWSSPHLDTRLVRLVEIERRQGREAAARFAAANAIPLDSDGSVSVLIHERTISASQTGGPAAGGDEPVYAAMAQVIIAHVAELGGEVRGRTQNLIEARVAIEAVERLPGPREIGWIEPAPRPFPMQVMSQGVGVTRADQVQASAAEYRPSDTPIRVGVLDSGFEGYPQLLGTELPAGVTTRSFHSEGIAAGSVHGTACAEIVHDMAPDAELYLANFESVISHSEAVDWLIAQQVDVISYSQGWFNMGPGDGRGVINDHVRRAMDAGIEWVGSAGNSADRHWEATFSDTNGNSWHNYTPMDHGNSVWLEAGATFIVFLNWDDWFVSDQDYDLYIFDQSNNLLAWSENVQTGTQPPREATGIIAPRSGVYWVAIRRYSASRNVRLEAFFEILGRGGQMQYIVPEGSLTIPADTDGSIAVGATYWSDDVSEPFSSWGPTTDGRTKPDLSAPDGVDTATYLAEGFPFYGTSAAAPHVAGAIALMKSRFGLFNLDQIVDILYGRAADRGPAGKDNQYGEGRLDVIG